MIFKERLKELIEGYDAIPGFFTRGGRLYLTGDAKVALLNKQNICCSNDGGIKKLRERRYRTYTIKTFFLGRPKLDPCVEKEVMDTIEEFLLFKKLRENQITAREIIHCKNQEIRRELLDAYGYERFLIEMKGVILHSDGDSQLIKLNWHEKEEPIKLVRVKDSTTGRWYVLRVPPTVKTCRQAVAWTFDLAEPEYHPIKET